MTETIDRTYVTELEVDGIVSEIGSVVFFDETGAMQRIEEVGQVYRRSMFQVLNDVVCSEDADDHEYCIGGDAMAIRWDDVAEAGQDVLL